MTTATMALTELAEKGADIDVPRQMVQFMAQRMLGMSGVSKSQVSRLCAELTSASARS